MDAATLWAAAGVVAAVLSTLAIVWVTLRVGNPKRRLYYGMLGVAPLLSAPTDIRAGLEVSRGGTVLKEPHVLTVELSSQGRLDIPSSAYDVGQPIRLDVGVQIVDILKTTSTPDSTRCPTTAIDGTSLKIGPSLLGKRQVISWTLLVDGLHPQLTCPDSPLIDVDVCDQKQEDARRDVWRMITVALTGGVSLAAAAVVASAAAPVTQAVAAAVVGAMAVLAAALAAAQLRQLRGKRWS